MRRMSLKIIIKQRRNKREISWKNSIIAKKARKEIKNTIAI
jgi:hypothetical protein